jgi:hypothetical protein
VDKRNISLFSSLALFELNEISGYWPNVYKNSYIINITGVAVVYAGTVKPVNVGEL